MVYTRKQYAWALCKLIGFHFLAIGIYIVGYLAIVSAGFGTLSGEAFLLYVLSIFAIIAFISTLAGMFLYFLYVTYLRTKAVGLHPLWMLSMVFTTIFYVALLFILKDNQFRASK